MTNPIKIKNVKTSKQGNSYFFRIPIQFINNEVINPEKMYNLEIKEKLEEKK